MKTDFIKKNDAVKLAKRLINSAELNETIVRYGYKGFDDISSQIDFWNQHIYNCLLDNNKNISLNEEFKNKAKFYCLFLEEVGDILKTQSLLWKEEPETVLKNM
ncbi:TPA: hypothetical protein ACIBKF_005474 [Salmonella enterica subsp. enterica serovar 6,7:y:-]